MPVHKRRKDEYLPNGSIICWSRRKDPYIPIICGSCNQERFIKFENATRENFSGICRPCAQGERWQDEVLPNDSVVYWSHRDGQRVPVKCGICGTQHITFASNIRRESFTGLCRRCLHSGPRSNTWRGGRVLKRGYIYVKVAPNHPFYVAMASRTGYIAEHRLVMAEYLGRPLKRTEVVHHKNGNKTDNRIENLELFMSFKEHGQALQQRQPHPGYESVHTLTKLYEKLKKLFEPEA